MEEELAVDERDAEKDSQVIADAVKTGEEIQGESAVRTLCGQMGSELKPALTERVDRNEGERIEPPGSTEEAAHREEKSTSPVSRSSQFWGKFKPPCTEPMRGQTSEARKDPDRDTEPETKREDRKRTVTSEKRSEDAGERWMNSYSWNEQRKFQREATASRIKYRERFPQMLQDSIYSQVKGRKKSSKNRNRN